MRTRGPSADKFDARAFRHALTRAVVSVHGREEAVGQLLSGSPAQLDLMTEHAGAVWVTTRQLNLTAVTDPAEMAIRHYADSLTCCFAADFSAAGSVCDVGSGAGYPGIPLAILFPGVRFTLLDSARKKAEFLGRVVAELGLANCDAVAERAETIGRGPQRESFGMVVSRAVSSLPVIAEYCLPLVRIGGAVLAMRGPAGIEEAKDVTAVATTLGGGPPQTLSVGVGLAGERVLVLIPKDGPTPARYPRRPGIPAKRPLL